jgi:hypothetical protein
MTLGGEEVRVHKCYNIREGLSTLFKSNAALLADFSQTGIFRGFSLQMLILQGGSYTYNM